MADVDPSHLQHILCCPSTTLGIIVTSQNTHPGDSLVTTMSWAEVAWGRGLLRAASRRQRGGRGEKVFGMRSPWWLMGMQWELLQCSEVEAEEEGSTECPCAEPGQQQTGRAAGPWQRAATGRMCVAP